MLRPLELVTTGFACAGDELGKGGREARVGGTAGKEANVLPQGGRQRWRVPQAVQPLRREQ